MVPSPPATHSVVVLSKPWHPFPPCDWLSNPSAWENHNFLMTTRKTLMIMIFLSPIKLTGSVLESPPLTAQSHFLVFVRGEPLKCQKSWAFSCPDSSIPIYPYSDQTNVSHEISHEVLMSDPMTNILIRTSLQKPWLWSSNQNMTWNSDVRSVSEFPCLLVTKKHCIIHINAHCTYLTLLISLKCWTCFWQSTWPFCLKSEVLSTFYTAFLLFLLHFLLCMWAGRFSRRSFLCHTSSPLSEGSPEKRKSLKLFICWISEGKTLNDNVKVIIKTGSPSPLDMFQHLHLDRKALGHSTARAGCCVGEVDELPRRKIKTF